MAYGYLATATRASSSPALMMGGIIATCLMNAWMIKHRRSLQIPFVGIAAVATAYSILANMIIGHTAAANTAGGESLADYLRRAARSSRPSAQSALVHQYPSRPAFGSGKTDDIAIVGDCEAVYFNTGDRVRPLEPGRAPQRHHRGHDQARRAGPPRPPAALRDPDHPTAPRLARAPTPRAAPGWCIRTRRRVRRPLVRRAAAVQGPDRDPRHPRVGVRRGDLHPRRLGGLHPGGPSGTGRRSRTPWTSSPRPRTTGGTHRRGVLRGRARPRPWACARRWPRPPVSTSTTDMRFVFLSWRDSTHPDGGRLGGVRRARRPGAGLPGPRGHHPLRRTRQGAGPRSGWAAS